MNRAGPCRVGCYEYTVKQVRVEITMGSGRGLVMLELTGCHATFSAQASKSGGVNPQAATQAFLLCLRKRWYVLGLIKHDHFANCLVLFCSRRRAKGP